MREINITISFWQCKLNVKYYLNKAYGRAKGYQLINNWFLKSVS